MSFRIQMIKYLVPHFLFLESLVKKITTVLRYTMITHSVHINIHNLLNACE